MGGSNSHLGSRPPPRPPGHHRRPPKRSFSSSLACGGAVSSLFICGASSSASKIEDDPAELLVNSAEHGHLDEFRTLRKNSAVFGSTESGSNSPNSEVVASAAGDTHQTGDGDAAARSRRKYLYNSKQLVPHRQLVSSTHSNVETPISLDVNQLYGDSVSASRQASIDVNGTNNESRDVYPRLTHHDMSSSNELVETSSDESSTEICGNAVRDFSNFHSGSASAVSNPPSNNHISRDDTIWEVDPIGSGLVDSERGPDRRDEDTTNVDGVSASNMVYGTVSEMNNERTNRRLFWDTFSRRSRRYHDSRTYLFPDDDSDYLGLHGRWLLDYSGDFLGEGVGGDFRSFENETRGHNDSAWHTRSEIIERLRSEGNAARTALCPRGIHPGGSCSCESIVRDEEPGSRASISRIVMLAETLFEVLDEIHRQPLLVPLPVVSLLAPESVVNSFPIKTYRKPEKSEISDDAAKCHICLAEYEEGNEIRILPCHHDYHMSCVDKWLKEIHGVCPLCRADVREGFTEGSASALEILSH